MKNLILPIIFFMYFVSQAHALVIESHISEISESQKITEDHLIKLDSGEVVFLDRDDIKNLEELKKSLLNKQKVEISLDETHHFISFLALDHKREEQTDTFSEQKFSFDPSIVQGLAEATNIFNRMRRNYQSNSQCYNRAHIWDYEEFKRSGLRSQKLFLFFTNRYIRNYRYGWWFHVTPMVQVSEEGAIVSRVLDRRYTSVPLTIKNWTDKFIYSHRTCPVAVKYSDYVRHQNVEDCYLIPRSMYFWQPRDIAREERTGSVKNQFISSEVNHAYWEAF